MAAIEDQMTLLPVWFLLGGIGAVRTVKDRNRLRSVIALAAATLIFTAAGHASEIGYSDIVSAHDTMTKVEWKKYEETLIGQHVCWTGTVMDVDKQVLGGYRISVDMDHSHIQDVYLRNLGKEADRYRKGKTINWCGTIKSVHGLFDVSITFDQTSLK